jgi:hypothetical protein
MYNNYSRCVFLSLAASKMYPHAYLVNSGERKFDLLFKISCLIGIGNVKIAMNCTLQQVALLKKSGFYICYTPYTWWDN